MNAWKNFHEPHLTTLDQYTGQHNNAGKKTNTFYTGANTMRELLDQSSIATFSYGKKCEIVEL